MAILRVELSPGDSEHLIQEKDKELSLKELDQLLLAASKKFRSEVDKRAYKLVLLSKPQNSQEPLESQVLQQSQEHQVLEGPKDITVISPKRSHATLFNMQVQIDNFKKEVLAIDSYLYNHANTVYCLTFEKTKRQKKLDALAAYEILEKVIKEDDYLIDPKNEEFFKIHNKAFRNFVICLVTGIAAILASIALFAGILLFSAFLPAVLLPGTKGMLIAGCLTVPILLTAGMFLIFNSIESYKEHREREAFIQSTTKTLPNFFRKSPDDLVKNTQNTARGHLGARDGSVEMLPMKDGETMIGTESDGYRLAN